MGMTMNMAVVEAETGGPSPFLRVGDGDEILVNVAASNPASSSVIRIDNSSGSTLSGQVSLMTRGNMSNSTLNINSGRRGSIALDNNQAGEQNFLVQVSFRARAGGSYVIMLSVTNAPGGQNRCTFMGTAMWP